MIIKELRKSFLRKLFKEVYSIKRESKMKKLELERILMDPEALKKLTERANMLKQREGEFGRTLGQPASIIQHSAPLPHQIRPTQDEIQANDFHIERKNLLANIGRFLPEMEKEDPKKILSILIDKCSKDPSEANQFLVEDAINRLTSVGELDKEAENLVAKAIETLSLAKKTEGQKDSIWSMLYEHSDCRGAQFFVRLGGRTVTYRSVRASTLRAHHLHDKISSLYVDASPGEVGGEVILFEHDRFFGRYARFTTTPGDPTVRNYINYVGDFINDRTSSILLVRRFNNELPPISLSSLISRDEVEDFVNSISRISMRGDPIFTWDMWPEGGDDHPNDPSRIFIEIKIPIRVDVPHWFDYDAEIWYWIYLYVDSSGILRGYVAYYGAWVEGGILTGSILDRIRDALPSTIGTVESFLNDALTMANAFGPFERRYFLPGTASSTGHTEDDVTIVLVRR